MASDVFGLPADKITLTSTPEGIETWDSIQHLNLVLALQQKFGLRFAPEEIVQMKSIGDVIKLVEGKLQESPS
jgi:acyl carrier protein